MIHRMAPLISYRDVRQRNLRPAGNACCSAAACMHVLSRSWIMDSWPVRASHGRRMVCTYLADGMKTARQTARSTATVLVPIDRSISMESTLTPTFSGPYLLQLLVLCLLTTSTTYPPGRGIQLNQSSCSLLNERYTYATDLHYRAHMQAAATQEQAITNRKYSNINHILFWQKIQLNHNSGEETHISLMISVATSDLGR